MQEIVQPLLRWFRENKRDLEWRRDNSAYSVLISEVMLQQTRAQAVRPYYVRFMQELPTFYALAECPPEKLLKLWEGLGYYSRVRNLQKCAVQIVEKYQGIFPDSYDEAIRLPGIGMYTCGAVLSRTYNLKYAAVDGNVLRVLSRYLCFDGDILSDKTKGYFKVKIEEIMPKECGEFNESLMELGATVCMPKIAKCEVCPIQGGCRAYQRNCQLSYPKKAPKKEKRVLEYTCLFVTDGDKIVLVPKKQGVLKQMPAPFLIDRFLTNDEALSYVANLGLEPVNEIRLEDKSHIFTHQIWYMRGYRILVRNTLDYPAYTASELMEKVGVSTCFKQFFNELFSMKKN